MLKQPLIITLLLCCLSIHVYGQFEQIVNPDDIKQQTIVNEPVTLNKGFLRAGISASFQRFDRYFDVDGTRGYLLNTNTWRKAWSYYLSLEYGVTDWFQLSVSQPYMNGQTYISYELISGGFSEYDTTISGRSRQQGLSDLNAGFSIRILKEGDQRPSITGSVMFTIPTGRKKAKDVKSSLDYNGPTGSGCFTGTVNINIRKVFYPFSAILDATYNHTFKGETEFMAGEGLIEYDLFNTLIFTGGFYAHLNDWIAIGNLLSLQKPVGEMTYYYDPPAKVIPKSYNIGYNPVVYFQIRRFRFYEQSTIPLFGKDSSADPVYLIGLQYMF